MIQGIKSYFQDKIDELDGDSTKAMYIGLAVLGLGLGIFFYYRHVMYRTYHKHPPGVTQVAQADPAPEPIVTPAPYTPPAPPAPPVETAAVVPVVTTISSNSLAASDTSDRPGDSMMSALSPATRPEAIPPGVEPAKTTVMAAPAVCTPVKPRRPAAPLTDAQKLVNAAQDRFDSILDMARKNPDAYGLAVDDKLDSAKLGDPIPVYSITDAGLTNYHEGQPIKPILQNTREWLFPVMVNGHICCMLSVRRAGDQYSTGKCSRALAMVYEKIEERWPASDGYHPQLVANPNFTGYYFTVPELPAPNLTETSEMFRYNPTLSPVSVVLASWQ